MAAAALVVVNDLVWHVDRKAFDRGRLRSMAGYMFFLILSLGCSFFRVSAWAGRGTVSRRVDEGSALGERNMQM
jgi:hypothetical protein